MDPSVCQALAKRSPSTTESSIQQLKKWAHPGLRSSLSPLRSGSHSIAQTCVGHGRRYTVKGILGQGTFGQVVECTSDVAPDAPVAVKVIKNQAAFYHQVKHLEIWKSLWSTTELRAQRITESCCTADTVSSSSCLLCTQLLLALRWQLH